MNTTAIPKTSDADVAVIGAGPAGFAAATAAAERGLRTVVIEHAKTPLRKLLISGKGRCNVTNDCGRDDYLSHVIRGSRFLYSSSSAWSPRDIMEHFEERSRDWDRMFDQIVDKELSQYKICEACGQAVPSDLDICPNCKAKLPDHTVAVWICRHCGAKNRTLDMYCVNCGKKFELVPEENKEK